jgi:hypothetical protein
MPTKQEKLPVTPNGRPITPEDIDISRHLFDAFGNMETEISAHYIISLCQQKGGWESFTQQEIENYYRSKGHEDGFTFNALIEPMTQRLFGGLSHTVGGGFIIKEGDIFKITPQFIERAYKSSPSVTPTA